MKISKCNNINIYKYEYIKISPCATTSLRGLACCEERSKRNPYRKRHCEERSNLSFILNSQFSTLN